MTFPFSPQVSAGVHLFFSDLTTQDQALSVAREFRDQVSEMTADEREFSGMWQVFPAIDAAAIVVTLGHSRHAESVIQAMAQRIALEQDVKLEKVIYEIDGAVTA